MRDCILSYLYSFIKKKNIFTFVYFYDNDRYRIYDKNNIHMTILLEKMSKSLIMNKVQIISI